MREIKYRAWLKNEHKMVDVAEISWKYKRIEWVDNKGNGFVALFDEIVLM